MIVMLSGFLTGAAPAMADLIILSSGGSAYRCAFNFPSHYWRAATIQIEHIQETDAGLVAVEQRDTSIRKWQIVSDYDAAIQPQIERASAEFAEKAELTLGGC